MSSFLHFDKVDWSRPDLLAEVIKKWTSGDWSAQEIAETIPGATRMAILGKMHRLDLQPNSRIHKRINAKGKIEYKKQITPLPSPPASIVIPEISTTRPRYPEVKRCKCGSAQLQPGRNKCARCITAAIEPQQRFV